MNDSNSLSCWITVKCQLLSLDDIVAVTLGAEAVRVGAMNNKNLELRCCEVCGQGSRFYRLTSGACQKWPMGASVACNQG